jgi:hypothetical protein
MTDDELYTKRITNYIIIIVVNCCIFGADTGLSAYAATYIGKQAVIAAPVAMGFIAG